MLYDVCNVEGDVLWGIAGNWIPIGFDSISVVRASVSRTQV